MYSIDFNPDIIQDLGLIDVDLIFPHEKIIEKNTSTISNFLKSFNDHIILSSILCCSKSMVIIDGHHRYFSLKKLGFKKIPVTKINYFSDDIKTSIDQKYSKDQIIEHGINGDLMEPKSTNHIIYCNKTKEWQPIMLLSSLFKVEVNK
ncbi:MAG: hypothetical protein ACKVJS_02235 [Flavobacteriales bacterium]|jgi:hypothetical protein|tara:strand:+ start:2666 stop:3109 length:444 start_codon:yes stop_codon:yes gene_type:complete